MFTSSYAPSSTILGIPPWNFVYILVGGVFLFCHWDYEDFHVHLFTQKKTIISETLLYHLAGYLGVDM